MPRTLSWKACSRGRTSASSLLRSSLTRLYEHLPMARSPENFLDTRIGAQLSRSASSARIVVPSGQLGTRPVLKSSATFSA